MHKKNQSFSHCLETLRMMIPYLGPQRTFRANLEFFLRMLAERHDFMRAHLVLFEPETGLLRLRYAETMHAVHEASYAPGVGVTGQVFASGKPVIIEKMRDDPHFLSLLFTRTDEELETLAFISVPILTPLGINPLYARDVVGTLNVDTLGGDKDDLAWRCLFLEVVASLIANGAAYLQDEMARLWRFDVASSSRNYETDDSFFAFSKVMRHIMEQATHLAQGRTPILLLGETGVGKERLAKRIHMASPRKEMPFVVCHCGAMQESKMLHELVGYQKDAFEGAVRTHKGFFEQAQSGTLFLDTVENLTLDAQQALLLLLEEHEIKRLGAVNRIVCDVRVLASTHASHNSYLEKKVQEGTFLKELFLRLNMYTVSIPPLRERREDIIPLAERVLEQLIIDTSNDAKAVKRISYPALQLLTHYYWPGNVPELQKCMEQAAQNCEDGVIRASDLPPSLQTAVSTDTATGVSLGDAVAHFEKEMIADALIQSGGNVQKAASLLQSSYRIVNYKVKKYKIDPRQF